MNFHWIWIILQACNIWLHFPYLALRFIHPHELIPYRLAQCGCCFSAVHLVVWSKLGLVLFLWNYLLQFNKAQINHEPFKINSPTHLCCFSCIQSTISLLQLYGWSIWYNSITVSTNASRFITHQSTVKHLNTIQTIFSPN